MLYESSPYITVHLFPKGNLLSYLHKPLLVILFLLPTTCNSLGYSLIPSISSNPAIILSHLIC